jgi:hypothetical protein
MLGQVLLWGTAVGVIHFVVIGAVYGNPLVDANYKAAQKAEPGVRKWPSQPRYLLTQFLGTQVEVYLLTLGYFWLRPKIGIDGTNGTLALALLFAGIRVYPRFWNMWIQSTYPNRLLGIELINGTLSTLTIVFALHILGK